MQMINAEIEDIKLIVPDRHNDFRGFFSEVFKDNVLRQNGVNVDFVQENHSLSTRVSVIRGLHFQIPPFAQAKLLRVTAGSIYDVTVDLLCGSRN